MKTVPKNDATSRPTAAVLTKFGLLSLALLSTLRAAETEAPKDHALFAGATVKVDEGSASSEVVGAQGSSVLLLSDGKVHNINRNEIHSVRVERTLKLTDVIARIDNTSVTPTLVGGHADLFGDMHMQMLMSDMASDAQSEVARGAAAIATFSGQTAAWQATDGDIQITPEQAVAAETPYNAASRAYVSTQAMVDSFGHALNAGSNNALKIACDLSTPRPMKSTYAVILTEFSTESDKNPTYNVDVEPIGALGPKAKKVTFTQAGFPAEFTVKRVDLHLYSGDLELATNLSDNRIDITMDDAMRYVVLAYVASHPKDTLPGAPLRIALPADFKQKVSSADLSRTFYLTVSAEGRVEDLSADPDHPVPADSYVDSTVRKFIYKPALKDGKPVASVVSMRLDTFVR